MQNRNTHKVLPNLLMYYLRVELITKRSPQAYTSEA